MFTGRLEAAGVHISMDGKGRALDNVFVERLWWSVKYEHVYLHDHTTVKSLHRGLARYLACSLETKSEIVVPVFAHGKVVGELDIDSHFPAAFGPEDQQLVQHCAALVGKKLEASEP